MRAWNVSGGGQDTTVVWPRGEVGEWALGAGGGFTFSSYCLSFILSCTSLFNIN